MNGLETSSNVTQANIDKYKTAVSTARTSVNTALTAVSSAETAYNSAKSGYDLKLAGSTEEAVLAQKSRFPRTMTRTAVAPNISLSIKNI